MSRAILRMAWRTSWGGGRSDRFRTLVVATATVIATLTVCGAWSAKLMTQRVVERDRARNFEPVGFDADVAAQRKIIFDTTPDGDQIYVVWFRFVSSEFDLPGVPFDTAPNTWLVSPELNKRMRVEPALARRFPGARLIGSAGVASADELLAYRIVDNPALFSTETGAENLSEQRARVPLILAADLASLSVIRGSVVLLAIPALAIMIVAIATISPSLERRMRVLHALGALPRHASALAFAQAVASGLPGAAIAVLAWRLVSTRLTVVPFVGRPVLPGDLALSLPAITIGAAATVVAAGLIAGIRRRPPLASRPSAEPPVPPGHRRLLPLLSSLVLMAVGSGVVGDRRDPVFAAGLLLASVAAIWCLPLLLHHVGRLLAEGSDPLSLLAGRRLSGTAAVSARGYVAFGTLLVVLPIATTVIAANRTHDETPIGVTLPVGVVGSLPEDEAQSMKSAAGAVPVQIRSQADADHLLLSGDCRELSAAGFADGCGPNNSFRLTGQLAAGYENRGLPIAGSASVSPGSTLEMTLLVSRDWAATDDILRDLVANRQAPGPPTILTVNPRHEAPVVRWLVGGLLAAATLASIALVINLVAQAVRIAGDRMRLRFIGAQLGFVRRLSSAEAAVATASAGLICTSVGAVAVVFYRQMVPATSMPLLTLGLMAIGTAAASGLCAAASWVTAGRADETMLRAD